MKKRQVVLFVLAVEVALQKFKKEERIICLPRRL